MTTTQSDQPAAGAHDGGPATTQGAAGPLPAESGQVSEREARQVAEAARETEWRKPSFGKELFLGRFRLDLIDPWPQPDPEQTAARRGRSWPSSTRTSAPRSTARAIERDARIPDEVFHGLAELGAFGMKIDEKYGGLGLSNLHYCQALTLAGSVNPSIGALLVGAPVDRRAAAAQDLRHRRAEADVPAPAGRGRGVRVPAHRARRRLRPGPPGHHRRPRVDGGYLLNGVKLWATNGTRGHAARRDGAGAEGRGPPRRHHRVRGRGRRAGHHGRAAQRVPRPARPGEQRHPVPRRVRARRRT